MQPHRKFINTLLKLPSKFWRTCQAFTKRFVAWILRGLFFLQRRDRLPSRGFILPTVVMVMLVVVLLTTALVLRSFDRSRSASNIRVSEAVLKVASPAIERAKAKIDLLFEDPTLPRSTPTDVALYNVIKTNAKYTFGDEDRLKIALDLNGNSTIETGINLPLEQDETSTTAWRFPADTDNNGKYDSYVLYGIYFRSPTRGNDGQFNRERKPLDARTPPMDNTNVGGNCAAALGTSASLVGSSDWYKAGPNLKKSFFVYTVTVPITGTAPAGSVNGKSFETFSGTNPGFAAVEYQQDRTRVPLSNNAVLYEDDLVIVGGTTIKLNGRIMTNSNLFAGRRFSGTEVELYQVSSPGSCFYQEENGKIIVGGNIGRGSPGDNASISGDAKVDLFRPNATPQTFNLASANQTTSATYQDVYYSNTFYEERLGSLVTQWTTAKPTANDNTAHAEDPDDVKSSVAAGTKGRLKALEDYFRDRLRRIPRAEVLANPSTVGTGTLQAGTTGNTLRPVDTQVFPVSPTNNASSNNGLDLQLKQPPATEPDKLKQDGKGEQRLGDRILVGNGLPPKWFNVPTNAFVGEDTPQAYAPANPPNTDWDAFTDQTKRLRSRTTRITPLSDLGNTEPGGFWEQKAAESPLQRLDGVGGLRVVTGAGIYRPGGKTGLFSTIRPNPTYSTLDTAFDDLATLENEKTGFTMVWPDTMPQQGDLVMRASVVYHYRQASISATNKIQTPIACVSNYYDPTNRITSVNQTGLPTLPGDPAATAESRSNNGIVYNIPPTTTANVATATYNASTGLFSPVSATTTGSYRDKLNYQANLIFPNGRFVNPALREALRKLDTQGKSALNLGDQAAIDAATCAIYINEGSPVRNSTLVPDLTIYEKSFLDAREVKKLEDSRITSTPNPANDYDLPLEERQPSEVRVTVLDLDRLRRNPTGGLPSTASQVPGPEYLLPDSGIVYVTRNDALPDASFNNFGTTPPTNAQQANNRQADRKRRSPVDFSTDPTRRPNGVLLVNGASVARGGDTNNFKDTEKGLILATNLPVYIQADADNRFNAHTSTKGGAQIEEFNTLLPDDFSKAQFYGRQATDLNPNFACRKNDPRLPNCTAGDLWRPVTVIADGITLLSNNFRFGYRNEGDFDLRKNVEGKNIRVGNTADLNDRVLIAGYDVDGSNSILPTTLASETAYGFDLNGNGTIAENVQEDRISVTAVRRLNGFFDNNYVTSAQTNIFGTGAGAGYPLDLDTGKSGFQGSSYLHNGVTPVQRRVDFSEYVMEYCQKPAIELCGPTDWKVGLTANVNAKATWDGTNLEIPQGTLATDLQAGTTIRPAAASLQQYPRRVAFLRDKTSGRLILDTNNRPIPLGVNPTSQVQYYLYPNEPDITLGSTTLKAFNPTNGTGRPRFAPAALWYRTVSITAGAPNPNKQTPADWTYIAANPLYYHYPLSVTDPAPSGLPSGLKLGTTQQPVLAPVLQITSPIFPNTGTAPTLNLASGGSNLIHDQLPNGNYWVQVPSAASNTFNLTMVTGDTPIREGEGNGALVNFVRTLENWTGVTVKLSGSIIQAKRSSYADAPWQPLMTTPGTAPGQPNNRSLFDPATPIASPVTDRTYPRLYRTIILASPSINNYGSISFYAPPDRQLGYDVGLLSQLPDLFSQRFTTPSTTDPDEFYREVPRDDAWVKGLMCAAVANSSNKAGAAGATYTQYAIADQNQRPTECKITPQPPFGPLPYPPNP